MPKCKVQHCGRNYDGYVIKVCAICWDNFEVCPECLYKYERLVCPECIKQGMKDNAIDDLNVVVEKY